MCNYVVYNRLFQISDMFIHVKKANGRRNGGRISDFSSMYKITGSMSEMSP